MKTYDEYMDNIQRKAKAIKKRRRIAASSLTAVFVLTLALTLFWPNTSLPSGVIQGMDHAANMPLTHKNNYKWLAEQLSSIKRDGLYLETDATNDTQVDAGAPGEASEFTSGGQIYQETTDNQVEGVIEGDLFKRSDKYLYYLRYNKLTIYSIEKENSKEINSFDVLEENLIDSYNSQMFLSADCKTLTVISYGYGKMDKKLRAFTIVAAWDVSDPENVTRIDQICFAGSFLSARTVDDDLLLMYQYYVDQGTIDYNEPATFVPVYGKDMNLHPVDADDIYCPENPTACRYTVVAKLDGKSLEVKDTAALLSYSQQIYVSKNNVYVTHTTTMTPEDDPYTRDRVTQITGICYTGDELEVLGTVRLEGFLDNQYYMDEHEGILRVVTSTVHRSYDQKVEDILYWVNPVSTQRNCNLYCIDLATWKGVSAVVGFAPDGEEVTSARFDGTNAYICTAERVLLTDPVYFFDLSDVNNITYKHTPVIDGYSSSLVNFGDHLLGIGVNEDRNLKVEVYRQTENAVESVACYERNAMASEIYKSYLIDRENKLIGIPILAKDENWETKYLLLHFDGYQLTLVQELPVIGGGMDGVRATIIDGYLYVLSDDLQVVKL